MTLHLTIRDTLIAARKAFNAGQLQIQIDRGSPCLYAGPCAIGAALTPEQRVKLDRAVPCDKSTDIRTLVDIGRITVDVLHAFERLQSDHDAGDLEDFTFTLAELEGEYL